MRKLLIIFLALFCAGCGSSWKAEGKDWKHPLGITVPSPEELKPGEASGSTLIFHHADSATTYFKVTACATEAEAEKLALARMESLKKDIQSDPRWARSQTPYEDALTMFKLKKEMPVPTVPNIAEMTAYIVRLGYRGAGGRWIYYESSHNGRSFDMDTAMRGHRDSIKF